MLGWTPFVEPLNALQDVWYLLVIPFSFGIAMIYKAMRMQTLEGYWRHVSVMTTQILVAMVAFGVLLAVLVQVIIPALPFAQ